jgi:hypothetical protein
MAEQIICSTISNAHRGPLCSHRECAERLKAPHSKSGGGNIVLVRVRPGHHVDAIGYSNIACTIDLNTGDARGKHRVSTGPRGLCREVRVYARVCNVPRRSEIRVPLQLRNDCPVGVVRPPSAQIRRWDWRVQINEQNDDTRLRNHLAQQPDPEQFQFLTDGRPIDGCLIAGRYRPTCCQCSVSRWGRGSLQPPRDRPGRPLIATIRCLRFGAMLLCATFLLPI